MAKKGFFEKEKKAFFQARTPFLRGKGEGTLLCKLPHLPLRYGQGVCHILPLGPDGKIPD